MNGRKESSTSSPETACYPSSTFGRVLNTSLEERLTNDSALPIVRPSIARASCLLLSVGRKLKEDISILPTVINYGEFLHTRDTDLSLYVTPDTDTNAEGYYR